MKDKWIILWSYLKFKVFLRFETRGQIEKYQEKMIEKHFRFLKKNSLFYGELGQDIKAVPVMNKQLMMGNFNSLNTVGIDKDQAVAMAIRAEKTRDFKEKFNNITVGLSSGTSDHRGIFIVSEREKALWAGAILAKLLPNSLFSTNRIAFFLRADSNLYQTVNTGRLSLKFFDIYHSFEENLKKLQAFNPTILVAQPSVLIMIAEAIEQGKIQINPIKVISSAEVLETEDAIYLKKVFKKDVIHQVYQCTEGFLAATCEHGTIHINEDIIRMEKEMISKNRFIPIITDFSRKSQPIVRYRLNDILVEKVKPCACGSPFLAIEKIEGREDDIFLFKNDKDRVVKVFPDFIRRCILFSEEIRQYKIVQTYYDKMEVQIDHLTEQNKDQIIREIKALSNDLFFKMPTVIFSDYQMDMSKKMRRVERKFVE